MKCTQVLDGKKDKKPLFRYEKVGAERCKNRSGTSNIDLLPLGGNCKIKKFGQTARFVISDITIIYVINGGGKQSG